MSDWPALPFDEIGPTCEALQLWSQVVGKVRLAQTPWLNHSWQVPLYVSARGLTTSMIPHTRGGFDLEFDFLDQVLRLRTSWGPQADVALEPRSVASFHAAVMAALAEAGAPVAIHRFPARSSSPSRSPRMSRSAPTIRTSRQGSGAPWC